MNVHEDAENDHEARDGTKSSRVNAPIVVAIDGPAGSGKSSVSRAVADRLGYGILDTGAAYRALTWAAIRANIDLGDQDALLELLDAWSYQSSMRGTPQVSLTLRGLIPDSSSSDTTECTPTRYDVTAQIRTVEVSNRVSQVAQHPAVRARLNTMFRELLAVSGLPGVLVEGRDITTAVVPQAPIRILFTASAEVRATRRARELGPNVSAVKVLADLKARDEKDARVVDFFNPDEGVTLIDTSELDFEQSVQSVIDVIRAA